MKQHDYKLFKICELVATYPLCMSTNALCRPYVEQNNPTFFKVISECDCVGMSGRKPSRFHIMVQGTGGHSASPPDPYTTPMLLV